MAPPRRLSRRKQRKRQHQRQYQHQLPQSTIAQVLRALLRKTIGTAFQNTAFATHMAAQPWFPLNVPDLEAYNVGELLQIMRAACVQHTSLMPELVRKDLPFRSLPELVSVSNLITAANSSGTSQCTVRVCP